VIVLHYEEKPMLYKIIVTYSVYVLH